MVSTRNHPRQFPPPELSSSTSPSPVKSRRSTSPPSSPTSVLTKTHNSRGRPPKSSSSASNGVRSKARRGAWTHRPSAATLVWLSIAIPLVIWDCGYVLLRPYTLPGGPWHSPIWSLYAIYARVDILYSRVAWDAHVGFTGAQALLNVVETILYVAYVVIVSRAEAQGPDAGRGWWARTWWGRERALIHDDAAWAAFLGYTAAVMTVSKTALYWAQEYYSGFESTRHNNWYDLIVYYLILNGFWILLGVWMVYDFGVQILQGLNQAAGSASASSIPAAPSALKEIAALKDE